MLIVILASNEQEKELLSKSYNHNVIIQYIYKFSELSDFKTADAFFILREDINIQQLHFITQPLFIHSVISTLGDLNMPFSVSRINAWPSFLQRDYWEVVSRDQITV